MGKILILIEKKFHTNYILNALSNEDIIVEAIGGHIFTKDETWLSFSDETWKKAEPINLPSGETAYVFDKETICKNVAIIKSILDNNEVDEIINACDPDKNGDALFDYASKMLNLDGSKITRMRFCSFCAEDIQKAFNNRK